MHNVREQGGTQERSQADLQVAAVDLDEMAFAIALFFAASRGQVPLPNAKSNGFELRRDPQVHNPTAKSVTERLVELDEATPDDVSLTAGVAIIWHHYEGAEQRQAVCSRLVAFFSLMVRTRGAVANNRNHPVEGDPSSIVLDPAVIRAVAIAPLTTEGQFHDLEFRQVVMEAEAFGEQAMSPALSSIRSKVQLAAPVTDIVQDLVELLFACESTVAVAHSAEFFPFRVFEKISRSARLQRSEDLTCIQF